MNRSRAVPIECAILDDSILGALLLLVDLCIRGLIQS
jgi:hypothetical protein